jgi:hypothetical protein
MNLLSRFTRGQGVSARVLRSSSIIALSFAATQAMRLGSNLVLTRILFPEAFGLMALVTVFIVGLQMFSDTGIGPSILQNAAWRRARFSQHRLDVADPARCGPVGSGRLPSRFRRHGSIPSRCWRSLLPVAGIALLIGSFNPTRGETERFAICARCACRIDGSGSTGAGNPERHPAGLVVASRSGRWSSARMSRQWRNWS